MNGLAAHARWPWAWMAGLAAWLGAAGVQATPHSGMLSGPTTRTWWDATRTSLGYATPGTVVTPRGAEVDRDPEEVEDEGGGRANPRKPSLTPMQRQMVQGVVAEYVIYLKYLNLVNFRDGPVDWRNERFQYSSLVPLRDLERPNAQFRVDPQRVAQALGEMEAILVEIGEHSVPLVAEALRWDIRYHGSERRRRPPLDYRTIAAVPAGDYNVQALERFDDIAYGLGNHGGFIPSKSPTFVRNDDYRERSRRILLAIGRAALPIVQRLAADDDPDVAAWFTAVAADIQAGTMPATAAKADAPFTPPPVDPAARAKAEAERQAQARLARLYAIWQEAEVAREAGDTAKALELYRKILASDPLPNYRSAATERIAELETAGAAPATPGDGK